MKFYIICVLSFFCWPLSAKIDPSKSSFQVAPAEEQFKESSKKAHTFAEEQLAVQPDSTDNIREAIKADQKTREPSDSFELSVNKTKLSDKIQALNQFFTSNSSLKIHNKALELLKSKNEISAILLLKKNFYQNLFPPSYFLLSQLEEPVSFSLVFLLIGFIIISLITVVFFILYLKTFHSFYFKNLLAGLFVFAFLLGGHLFFFKNQVSPLTETYLKLAPIESAPNTVTLPPLENLAVLKEKGKWLKVKNQKKQTGWILKQQVFQIF